MLRSTARRAAVLFILTFAGASAVAAQSQLSIDRAALDRSALDRAAPLEITRLPRTIEFDGRPTDAEWAGIPDLPLTMYFPTFRGTPKERSVIRVTYDNENLYAAGWFYDTDASGIRINSLYRDRWNGDDAFAIYIDAFNDNQTAKWFGITPAGMRFDLLVSNDGEALNASWDGFWEAKTTITDEGWFVEVRIPFSTLGFQSTDDVVTMGLTVTRLVSRTNERVTFPDIDPQFEFRQPSQARDITLRGVRASRPVWVTPYVLSGANQRTGLDGGGTEWITRHDPARWEAGGDLRYAVSANSTLDLTVNTDFAQVEADDQQVNLDRFSLFFPEKRRFFQERSAVFDFETGAGSRLFHSRRIGLTDDAQPVPVMGGARYVGRAGEWDLGLLGMRTEQVGVMPGENFGVLRARRRIIDDYSTVGAMLTTRTGDRTNTGLGVDAQIHLFGDDYFRGSLAATIDEAEVGDGSFADRSAFTLDWQRRASRGIWYDVTLARAGRSYDPGIGFISRGDYTQAETALNYFIFTDASRTWRRVFPGMYLAGTYRNGDGVLESGRLAVWIEAESKSGDLAWIEPQLFREDVATPFSIAGKVDVPVGGYTFANLWLYWAMNAGRRIRATTDLQTGTYFHGYRTQLTFTPTWNVSPHLELGLSYLGNYLRFGDRDQSADIHLARLRIYTALNAKASGNAFVQYNSTTNRVDLNLRLRYNFREGTDLWIVYNEGLLTDREIDDPLIPRRPFSASRGVTIKYSRTFTFG
jgi:Domain of unknown function (DUF5916)/Carbohydrate family 9 binding domain-like